MSLSKTIKHCRKCLCLKSIRHFQSDSSSAAVPTKMTTKIMSITQWKIMNQIKEYYNKYSSDKSVQQLFNKELASVLQRFQPSVYGKDIIRNFDSNPTKDETTTKTESALEVKNETNEVEAAKEPGYSLPNVLTGLKLKIGQEMGVPPELKPKWKLVTAPVTQSSVSARTHHVISMICSAESDSSRLRRIEDLTAHLQQYPESRHHAFQEGAVRILLQIRYHSENSEVCAAIQEAFAVLGYMDPLPGRGIRILSMDGGGTRGLLVISMLRKLEELTGRKTYEMFDMICGVSTGAIISCGLGASQKDLSDLEKYYKELSIKIFSQNAFWGASSLFWSHSYYDTKVWEQILKDYFGETGMLASARRPNSPKVIAISAIVNQKRASIYVFRNYSLPYRVQSQYMGGANHKIWEAVRASAAAPTYFEEFKLGNFLHQDGGIMVNNPTAVAVHEARQLWPNMPIQCVVSFGTGRNSRMDPEPIDTGNSSSWKNKFLKILDSATDTESVHMMLNDLLPPNTYYRFNPHLTEMLQLAEIRTEKLAQLERDALMYMRRNEDRFQLAAKALLDQKTTTQKALDWLNLQREVMGVTQLK